MIFYSGGRKVQRREKFSRNLYHGDDFNSYSNFILCENIFNDNKKFRFLNQATSKENMGKKCESKFIKKGGYNENNYFY